MRFLGFLEVVAQVAVCVLISPAIVVVCLGLGIQQERENAAKRARDELLPPYLPCNHEELYCPRGRPGRAEYSQYKDRVMVLTAEDAKMRHALLRFCRHTGELLYVWEDTERPADIDKEQYKYVSLKVTAS
jgi:hypothetical protein